MRRLQGCLAEIDANSEIVLRFTFFSVCHIKTLRRRKIPLAFSVAKFQRQKRFFELTSMNPTMVVTGLDVFNAFGVQGHVKLGRD
jgi:hypothetical protein